MAGSVCPDIMSTGMAEASSVMQRSTSLQGQSQACLRGPQVLVAGQVVVKCSARQDAAMMQWNDPFCVTLHEGASGHTDGA